MSQAVRRTTLNLPRFTPTCRPPVTLALSADLADALTELCTLAAYSDGFTYTDDMAAVTKHIADRSSPAAIAACLARASARERAIIAR
jgi:hypothetical protein